jgi:predicted DNA-binding ribbon-helix-helix protein
VFSTLFWVTVLIGTPILIGHEPDDFAQRPERGGIAHAEGLAISRYFLRRPTMNSLVVKRSIIIAAHKTSVSLEEAFWKGLKEIAIARGTTLSNLVTSIDVERRQGNLSSCLRLFVLDFYRNRLSEKMSERNEPADVMGMRPAKSV